MQLNNRIGQTNTAINGQIMTIIGYRNSHDIDIQFEDETIVHNCRYDHFRQGSILNPNFGHATNKKQSRIGETRKMNCGLNATIIKYIGAKNIEIKFENGIIKRTNYEKFCAGTPTPMLMKNFVPVNQRIGMTVTQNCGETATLIEYNGANRVIVKFNDGTLINTTWNNFYKTKCVDKNKTISKAKERNQQLIGEKYKNGAGLIYTIVEIKTIRNITVRFDLDGLEKKTTLNQIRKKPDSICHPLFPNNNSVNYNSITGFRKLSTPSSTYYKCTCSKCGFQGLLNPNEIYSHKC